MKDIVNSYLNIKASVEKDLKEWVRDKSVPLDERWELFISSGLGSVDNWTLELKSLPDDAVMYDGLIHCSRYETMCMEQVLEILTDQVIERDSIYGHKEAKNICIVDVKEEILKEFIYSFTYDW